MKHPLIFPPFCQANRLSCHQTLAICFIVVETQKELLATSKTLNKHVLRLSRNTTPVKSSCFLKHSTICLAGQHGPPSSINLSGGKGGERLVFDYVRCLTDIACHGVLQGLLYFYWVIPVCACRLTNLPYHTYTWVLLRSTPRPSFGCPSQPSDWASHFCTNSGLFKK